LGKESDKVFRITAKRVRELFEIPDYGSGSLNEGIHLRDLKPRLVKDFGRYLFTSSLEEGIII
jgi:hypothetical protein